MNKKRMLGILGASLLFMTGLSLFSREVQNSISLTASAQSEVTYEGITYRIYDTHATVWECDSTATEVTVLSEINGYPVTAVENTAFFNCTSLISVTIPDSVTIIGGGAFYGCTSLEEVNLPDSITTIEENYRDIEAADNIQFKKGGGVFYNCKALKSITLPKNLESIGATAFFGCVKLNQIEVDENNQYYTAVDNVLYNKDMTELCVIARDKESYTIPETVTSIDAQAGYGCNKMKSITIPERVTEIGAKAFGYSSSGNAITGFIVYGVSGSAAETYALENGFTFEEIGSAPSTEPSSSEMVVGDFNGDGIVNAKDAAIILVYAAEVGAGNFKGTLPEFVETL